MDFKSGGKGLSIGKVAEKDNVLEVSPDWDLEIYGKRLIDCIYPVGSIFLSVNSTSPDILFRGTKWQRFSQGRVLVGIDEHNANFNASEKTGGQASVTLTKSQLPKHTHSASSSSSGTHCHKVRYGSNGPIASGNPNCVMYGWAGGLNPNGATWDYAQMDAGAHTHSISVSSEGGGESHTNLQPYTSVYMWKRIS